MLAFKKMKVLFVFFLAFALAFLPLLLGQAQAASLGSTTFFFEKMEVNTTNVGLVVILKPNSNFDSGGQLKISFPDSSSADWCKLNAQSLTVTGISQAPAGSIDSALPGILTGVCTQDAGGDYVVIGGVGALTANVSYGLEISPNANFSTGPDRGRNRVSLELSSGSNLETKLFSIYLLSSDTVGISAYVSDADSVVCSLSTDQVSLGVLYRGGSFVTSSHSLGTSTTTGSKGYYWTVFGKGNDQYAGLYNVGSGHIIRSLGTTVNLLSGEGFGLVVKPPVGSIVPASFQEGSFGVFGSISPGFDQARMILYRESEQTAHEDAVITLGARASMDSSAGSYQEILTYSCGGYIGGYTPLQLVVAPEVLDFGGGETEKTFAISNLGSGTLEWNVGEPTYVVGGSNWITNIEPISGKTRTSTDNVAVTVDQSDVSSGEHSAQVPVTSLGGGSSLLTINLLRIAALAELTTKVPYDIETTTAKSGGNITNDGGSSITSRGVCSGLVTQPTTLDNCTSDGIGVGDFDSQMSSLNSGSKYFVRAFAVNSQGIAYGNEYEFITKSILIANPASRDWENTNVSVNISTTGNAILGIEYCWTEESSCVPSTYVELLSVDTIQEGTGAWNLCYRSKDINDAKGTISCSGEYRIGKVNPTVTASNASATWYGTQRTATVSVSDGDSGIAEVRYNWGTNDMNLACTTGGIVTANNAELNAPAGGTTLYLCARDNAGNTNAWSGTYNWTGDEPSVGASEIYSGNSHNNTHFNGTIGLQSSVTDQGGAGLDETSCEVSINGGNWFTTGVTYVTGYCQYNDYTPNANFTIRFRISDNAENVGTSSLGSFTYDNTAPTTTATMTSPVGGTAYTCGEFTAENVRADLSCADNVGGSGCEATYPKYCTDANNTCIPATSYSTNVDITTEGTTYIRYFSSDNLTNNETVQSCEIKIDKSAPTGGSFVINNNDTYTISQTGNTLNVTCPTDSWTPIQMAYGNATDPTTPWDTCAATVSSYDLGSGDGTKTVYMKFRDGGLNTTSNLTDTIILDTVNPSISASNASATWYNTQRTATVSATDATSGIAEVRYNWGSSSVLNSNCDTLGTATSNGAILSAPSGGTTLYLCARDNAGRTNTWSGIYNWTSSEPSVGAPEIYSGNSHNTYFNGTISLQPSVTDQGGSGLNTSSCKVSINGTAYTGTGVTYSAGYCQYNNYTPNANFTIRFSIEDNAENVGTSSEGSFVYDNTAPDGGSVNNHNGFQTSTTIAVTVNRGTDAHSGMSETNSDYLLEYQSATLTNSTGACGTYGSWTNANVTETAIATSYNFTGTASNCYKFRYTVKDNLGNTGTYTGTDVTKIDTTAPAGGSFVINNNDARTNTTAVTLNVTCPSDGWATVQMAYGNSASPTNWVSCSSTASHTLASGDGTKTVYMRFRDGGQNTTSDVTDTIILDTTAPINGSFVINNNDTYTTSQTGNTLNVTCPTDSWTPIQMAYGNATDPTTPWDTCAATVSNYSLTAGDGTKTVYMKFRDGGLNTTSNITDTIILDTVDPSIAASNASATWYSTERTATVSATDATSGIAEVRYNWGSSSVLNSNCDTLGTATSNGAILSAPSGGTTLYLCARDNAGNTNTWSGEYNWKYEQSTAVTTGGCTSTIWGTNCTVTAAGGDGTGSYEFEKVSGDTCSINSTTGVVSSTGAGTCVVRARRLSDDNYYTSSWSTNHSITLNKQEQSAPTAPTCSTVTENSVTITACTGCEYRMGTGTAQGSTLFTGLSSGTTYTFSSRYVATADYNVSPWSSDASCTTLAPLFSCGGDITDSRDSQVYPTVEIGTQCWMAKNLAYLPSVVGPATASTTIPYYYVYGYTGTDVNAAKATTNYQTYGVLYNWAAAMDGDTVTDGNTTTSVQGICPAGWSLPSDTDWTALTNYVNSLQANRCDGVSGNIGKSMASTTLWSTSTTTCTVGNNQASNNSTGFNARPGGYRNTNGSFFTLGTSAYFWSSSPSGGYAWRRNLYSANVGVYRFANDQASGFSVRCLRD